MKIPWVVRNDYLKMNEYGKQIERGEKFEQDFVSLSNNSRTATAIVKKKKQREKLDEVDRELNLRNKLQKRTVTTI